MLILFSLGVDARVKNDKICAYAIKQMVKCSMKVKALLIDLDGTLVDASKPSETRCMHASLGLKC
jgi:predicted HAD superfamily phosphohydrolase YqeG